MRPTSENGPVGKPSVQEQGRLEPTGLFNLPNRPTIVEKGRPTGSVKKRKVGEDCSGEQDITVNNVPEVGPSKILKATKKTVKKRRKREKDKLSKTMMTRHVLSVGNGATNLHSKIGNNALCVNNGFMSVAVLRTRTRAMCV